ncbi:MAG TPA: hypothetical protein PLE28_02825 [bacterium]|nr:hypothetical protein [bacterium]
MNFESEQFSQKKEKPIKEGVDFIFEQNPELAQIGTKEQYLEYINSIFPESQNKNIWYHGTDATDIERFKISTQGTYGFGVYLMSGFGKYNTDTFGKNTLGVMVNIKNPLKYETDSKPIMEKLEQRYKSLGGLGNNRMTAFGNELRSLGYDSLLADVGEITDDYLLLFEPNQAHILNSAKDIENFKKFVEPHSNPSA